MPVATTEFDSIAPASRNRGFSDEGSARALVSLLVLGLPAIVNAGQDGFSVGGLRCEYLENPLGIDVAKPRLSWQLSPGPARAEADGLSHPGGQQPGEPPEGPGRPLGLGKGELRPVRLRRLRRAAADLGNALLLEGACLGQGWAAFPLECARLLVDGPPARIGLVRPIHWPGPSRGHQGRDAACPSPGCARP